MQTERDCVGDLERKILASREAFGQNDLETRVPKLYPPPCGIPAESTHIFIDCVYVLLCFSELRDPVSLSLLHMIIHDRVPTLVRQQACILVPC